MKIISKRYFHYWLEFLLSLTEKEIKARYKHAILGFLWVILNPLLQMLVIGFVFQFFIPVKIDNYFLFLFVGLLPWNFFSMTVMKSTPIYVFERTLIQKAKLPREAITLSIVLSNLFHLLISLVLLLIVVLILGKMNFSRLIFLPLILIWLIVLTSALSLFFSSLNVRFRDVNFVVKAIMPLWFYATPVVYTLDLIPKSLHFLFYLNPMTALIEASRFSILALPAPQTFYLMISLLSTLILAMLAIFVFRRESPNFDDWL
ncbi:MAG: ABC transporter permease [Candidatus Woesebacteria bacterium]